MLLFNAFCPTLMASEGFEKSKEIIMFFLRRVTSSNIVIGPQRKRFGTFISFISGFNTLGVGGIFCPLNS